MHTRRVPNSFSNPLSALPNAARTRLPCQASAAASVLTSSWFEFGPSHHSSSVQVTFAATRNRGAKIVDGNPVLVSRYFYCLSISRLSTSSLPCLRRLPRCLCRHGTLQSYADEDHPHYRHYLLFSRDHSRYVKYPRGDYDGTLTNTRLGYAVHSLALVADAFHMVRSMYPFAPFVADHDPAERHYLLACRTLGNPSRDENKDK